MLQPVNLAIRRRALEMLNELESTPGLEVVLMPAPDPRHSRHCIRAVQWQNPRWYSRFVSQYTNCRGTGRKRMKRPRTYIDRRRVGTALQRIVDGRPSGVYCDRLIDFINRELSAQRPRPIGPEPNYFAEGIKF